MNGSWARAEREKRQEKRKNIFENLQEKGLAGQPWPSVDICCMLVSNVPVHE